MSRFLWIKECAAERLNFNYSVSPLGFILDVPTTVQFYALVKIATIQSVCADV